MVHFSPPSNWNDDGNDDDDDDDDDDISNVSFLQQRNSTRTIKGTLAFNAACAKMKATH
jgi:hypothetical protein